jgi:predicted dehydrogenase
MRFAVIGSLGWAGSRHVNALAEMGQDIVALVDPGDGCAAMAVKVGAKELWSFD